MLINRDQIARLRWRDGMAPEHDADRVPPAFTQDLAHIEKKHVIPRGNKE